MPLAKLGIMHAALLKSRPVFILQHRLRQGAAETGRKSQAQHWQRLVGTDPLDQRRLVKTAAPITVPAFENYLGRWVV